jgi:hypothetical protein
MPSDCGTEIIEPVLKFSCLVRLEENCAGFQARSRETFLSNARARPQKPAKPRVRLFAPQTIRPLS